MTRSFQQALLVSCGLALAALAVPEAPAGVDTDGSERRVDELLDGNPWVRDPFCAPGSSEVRAIVKVKNRAWAIVQLPDFAERIVAVGDTLDEGVIETIDLQGLTVVKESVGRVRKPLPESLR